MISELTNANIPFISVPLPSSADNHQLKNAFILSEKEISFFSRRKKSLKTNYQILLLKFLIMAQY